MEYNRKKKTKDKIVPKLQPIHSLQGSVMLAPSTKEEEENERFARKVGINL
jgi:hypothetical protein